MNHQTSVSVFGEVLFDCFPTGEQVLGGAPFNVAWHLQALGHAPCFISRVGDDPPGQHILTAMHQWKMDTASIQIDPDYPTGHVEITLIEGEPDYTIASNCAYDFIEAESTHPLPTGGILYHGTLGLRQAVSRKAFHILAQHPELSIFLDVNLRSPWWNKETVYQWMGQACWVKLNQYELNQLGFISTDIKQTIGELQSRFNLQTLIVTQGKEGAIVLDSQGKFHSVRPEPIQNFVDTVGAGDAFSALFIHGLLSAGSITDTLISAQQFASQVIGLRGAIPTDRVFYQDFIN